MSIRKESGRVASQEKLADGIFSLIIETGLAATARPGQFVGVYVNDGAKLLPRPISVCDADPEGDKLRLVYRVAGEGTRAFTGLLAGDTVDLLGVLGNGYPLDEAKGKHVLLIGGGVGIPPLLYTAKCLKDEAARLSVALGYRDSAAFLSEDFMACSGAEVLIATDDGSRGYHGTALDAVRDAGLSPDLILACGPVPMLKAVQAFSKETGAKAYLSLEARMACGVGVCLGCVCETAEVDSHSMVRNARVCADGPVFPAEGVVL